MPMTDVVETDHEGKPFTARSFLQYLRRSNSIWWDGSSHGDECPWVFRGHSNAAWKLVPSAARPLEINKLRSIIEGLRKLPDEDPVCKPGATDKQNSQLPENLSPINRERMLLIEAQRLVLARFVKLGWDLSILDGNIQQKPSALELGHLPIRRGDGNFNSELPMQAQAQHHKVPTFLLDWTEDPVVAGHFAANGNSEGEPVGLAVWAMNVERAKLACQFDVGLGVHRPSPADNPYIKAQRGILTYYDRAEDFFDEKEYYPLLDEVIGMFDPERILDVIDGNLGGNQKNELRSYAIHDGQREMLKNWDHDVPCLRKIVLSGDCVTEFRELLSREGITKAHLMPTLDNASKTAFQLALDATHSQLRK